MVGDELPSSVFSDQLLLEEPVDGAALGAHVAEAMPVRDEIGEILVDLFLEPAKGSSPFQRGGQTPPGSSVAEAVGKVDHVLVPDVGREGIDEDEVQLVDLDGVLTVDAGVAGPEDDFARAWIQKPSMVKVLLIRQCGGDLLNVDAVQ